MVATVHIYHPALLSCLPFIMTPGNS